MYFMQSSLTALVFFGLLVGDSAQGEIIPADRRITWQGNVGILGGIPNRTTIFCDVTVNIPGSALLAVPNDGQDDRIAIQAALDLCPSNQVVYVPTGTYRINATLYVHSGITLRGAGSTSTVFQFSTSANKIQFGQNNNSPRAGPYHSVVGSPAKGDTSVTLSGTNSKVAVGNLLWLDRQNDDGDRTNLPLGSNLVTIAGGTGQDCTHCSRSSGTRAMSQIVEITGVNGNVVSFRPGLYWGLPASLSPEASAWVPTVKWAGCEDLKVSVMVDGGGDNWAVNGGKYCWVKNVESDYTAGDHVHVRESYRLEVRDSYFHDCFNHTSPGQRESSLMWGDTSASLYENNIIRRTFIGMYVNWGSAGNVFAYNFITNSFNSANNAMYGSLNWHGAHCMMNLFEGNVINRFNQDGVWGSASHETLFRNFVSGVDTWTPPGSGRGPEEASPVYYPFYGRSPFFLAWNTRHFNLVGNVIGSQGFRTNWPNLAGPGSSTGSPSYYLAKPPDTLEPTYYIPRPVFAVGYWTDGSGYHEGSAAWDSLIRHGNWDVVRNTNEWNGSISDTDIPSSLYLPGKPSWWGTLPWPAIGPDVTPMAGLIPAVSRWLGNQTGNQSPVAVATASPTTGVIPLTVNFSSTGSFDPEGVSLSYAWTFGDGGSSTAVNHSRTYTTAGNYSARLSVSDGINTASSAPITIRAFVPGPPVAVASATPTSGVAPLTVAFSSAGSYDPEAAALTFVWTFGDGTTSTAANPSHIYPAGTFNASLQVSDGTNTTTSSLPTITVTNPPPGVSLTSPANGANYEAPATVNLAASVTPNGHTITKVQFYNGAALLGEDSSAPYTLTWTNVGVGSYSLTGRVVYGAGATTDSPAVNVGVGGLVAAYGFDEGSGGTTADASGNGNNGTINGAVWTGAGKYGKALSFNAINSLVMVNDSASLDLTTGMTLEAWVNPTATTASWGSVIFKPFDSSQISYVLQGVSVPNRVPSVYVSPSADNLFGPSPLPSNSWSHLAATFDGSAMRLYVNGTLVASTAQSGTISSSGEALTIGGNALFQSYWLGLLDEVRIYNRALTAAEIQADMSNPIGGAKPLAPQNLRVAGQ